jgi:ubiquinone/menaquinone biosynthesis C-methylase UbiE
MLANVVDEMALDPNASILEVGSGSGVVCRWLAERVNSAITGVDLSPYMVGEARTLAASEGLQDRISFRQGSAETLPFADESFGAALSVTVMEEVDADRMLAEMVRVTRPGGRIGIVVRATDMPHWFNVALPLELREKVSRSVDALKAERGCADESLYSRVRAAG